LAPTTRSPSRSPAVSLLVAAPHLSVELLALLEFVASRLDVRVLTSEASLAAPILRMANPERLALRVVEGLHAKVFVVDNEAACLSELRQSRRCFFSQGGHYNRPSTGRRGRREAGLRRSVDERQARELLRLS